MVRRSGITVALHMLEARQVIKSHRKLVEILDPTGLLREADLMKLEEAIRLWFGLTGN